MTRKIGFDERKDRYGMFVRFSREMDVHRSLLNVETLTLLTRIGGIIGVGKQFLWIAITINAILLSAMTKLISCFHIKSENKLSES